MEPRKCFAREAKRLQFVEKSQRLSGIHSIAEESRAIWETVVGESWRNAEAPTQKPTKSLKSLALPRADAQPANIKALAEALATLLAMASHSVIPDLSTLNDEGDEGKPEK